MCHRRNPSRVGPRERAASCRTPRTTQLHRCQRSRQQKALRPCRWTRTIRSLRTRPSASSCLSETTLDWRPRTSRNSARSFKSFAQSRPPHQPLAQNLHLIVKKSVRKTLSQQNEKLFWTTYRWCVQSYRPDGSVMQLAGTMTFAQRPTEIILRCRILGNAARIANEIGVGWDPFNLNMIVLPSSSTK